MYYDFLIENFSRRAEQKFCGYWIRLTRHARSGKVGSSHCYLDQRPLHEIDEIVYEFDRKWFHRMVYVTILVANVSGNYINGNVVTYWTIGFSSSPIFIIVIFSNIKYSMVYRDRVFLSIHCVKHRSGRRNKYEQNLNKTKYLMYY